MFLIVVSSNKNNNNKMITIASLCGGEMDEDDQNYQL